MFVADVKATWLYHRNDITHRNLNQRGMLSENEPLNSIEVLTGSSLGL